MNFFWLIFASLISGIVGGMGMGGGTLLIPILTIFFEFSQQSSQGINLLVFLPMSIVALIIHFKNKLVDIKVGLPIIFSGVVSSICGSVLANNINSLSLKKIFGVFLIVVGIIQLIQTIRQFLPKKQKMINIKFCFRYKG